MKVIVLFVCFGILGLPVLTDQDEKAASIARGKSVYMDFCITCHLANGEGAPGIFPPLAKSDYLLKNRVESIKAVKFGQKGEITVNGKKYNGMMPSPGLTSEEIADVMNYVLNSWGNSSQKLVTVKEVDAVK